MKPSMILLVCGMLSAAPAAAQLKLNSVGKVGIGGVEPVATLQIKDPTTSAIWLQNGNGYKWGISNHMSGVYGGANSLAICRENNGRAEVPVMEFRQDRTYIHYRTYLGGGNDMDYPVLELENNQWMMFNAPSGKAGIIFRESGNAKRETCEYGARIYYDGGADALVLGTLHWNEQRSGLFLHRHGKVSVGSIYTGTAYQLVVYGDAQINGGSWIASDARYKTDITALGTETAKLKQLRGVSYHKEVPSQSDSIAVPESAPAEAQLMRAAKEKKSKSREYGFLAQEVQQLYPHLVLADDDGYLSVNYNGFIPLLVESVKEQQATIEALQAELAIMKKELEKVKKSKQ